MKFSTALASVVFFAVVQGSRATLHAHYCETGPATCVDVDPVPIRQCVALDHPGTVSSFEANVSCVLYSGVDCTGESKSMIRGEPNSPNFYASSFLCFPP